MRNFNFVYNYGFLADWLKANPAIMRNEVMRNLGMSDYKTFQNWTDGLTPMPLTQMMRFCNLYNVPLTAFFLDENARPGDVFAPIRTDSMIQPTCGWPEGTRAGKKSGDTRTSVHYVSNLPNYISDNISRVPKTSTDSVTQGERMRYLDIIEQQQAQIAELSREVIRLNKGTEQKKKIMNTTSDYSPLVSER